MSILPHMSQVALDGLRHLVEANPAVDWRTITLNDAQSLDVLDWCGLEREALTPLLRAYQRLAHILPVSEERRALALLGSGLHSAIQIAGLPRDTFLHQWSALFPGEVALGLAVHGAALSRRSELLPRYIDTVQRNEPHYRATRFR